jgi:Zn-dependent peptidase ImmA (M78 family)/transcriptional regulator with XRE-family HTH domain
MAPEFNPSRLVLARERRGCTKAALASAAGVTIRSVTNYEGGYHDPPSATLQRIAAKLELDPEFFYGPDLSPAPIEGASFRALKNLTARSRDQAKASATFALALANWINARFALPTPSVPRLSYLASPEAGAEVVRRDWSLGERPIGNMIHLLEAHGVRVFSLVEECAELNAFSLWVEDVPYIFLNTMKSAENSRMDAAHELGHLVMHWGHATPRGRDKERDAQAFGAAFLMPRGSILAEVPRTAHLSELNRAKRVWKVSLASLVYRMHVLGMLSDWQYRTAFIELSSLGYRRSEADGIPRETSQVLSKVFDALRAEQVSKSDVAYELAIPVEELNKVVFGLSLTALAGTGPLNALPGDAPALRVMTTPDDHTLGSVPEHPSERPPLAPPG